MEERNSKWVATVASIWIQCSSGSSYAFGIYSPLLKSTQNYNQSTLDSIAVFKDIGANFGLLSGLLYTSVATPSTQITTPLTRTWRFRGGPWVVLAAGAIQCFIGYFLIWLSVTGVLPRQPVWLMCSYMFLAAHAQTFCNTADVVTAVRNFPDHSGTIVGIMKGFLGLSGAILIQVYRTMFEDRPSSFLLMLAVLPTVVPLLLMYFVKTYQTSRVGDKKHLNGFSIAALVIAAYLMILIILQNIIVMNLQARIVTLLVLLSGLASPIGIAVRAHLMDSHRLSPTSSFERTPLLDEPRKQEAGNVFMRSGPIISHDPHNELSAHKKLLTRGEDLTLLQTMCTIDFWLLFVAMSCAMGSGLATVNNISQIGGSLGYTTVETSTLVSLWSIWNFLGRFGAGYVSDYFLHLKGWPRPIFMVVTLATMSVGHIVVASGLPGALYAGSILVGVCYGSQWSLMPTITSEIFGVRHMGTIFNTISIASPIGSYILSVWLVGSIYDKEASPDNKCTGAHCFMLSFLIMACVSLVGFVIALGLFFRTRRFYKQVIFEKLRQSATRLK